MTTVPLGKPESEHLEFKRGETLKEPDKICRAVVAFLNARGGEVWVGIEETDGRATDIDGIEDPDLSIRSLRDHLIETIEPSPADDEVKVEVVGVPDGRRVLQIRVMPKDARRPYAQLRKSGRIFAVRVADRIRPMSREEIFAPREKGRDEDAETEARDMLFQERERLQRDRKEVYWIRIQPVSDIPLDLKALKGSDYLSDPIKTGNRPAGWHFVARDEQAILNKDGLVLGDGRFKQLILREDGGLALTIPLENLPWNKEGKELNPYPLSEFPTSLFRLARAVYQDASVSTTSSVLADIALIGIEGWKLRPYSTVDLRHRISEGNIFNDGKDLVWEKPITFSIEDVFTLPDGCAFRLVRRVYQAFGYFDDAIPGEFDRSTGRLVMPQ